MNSFSKSTVHSRVKLSGGKQRLWSILNMDGFPITTLGNDGFNEVLVNKTQTELS